MQIVGIFDKVHRYSDKTGVAEFTIIPELTMPGLTAGKLNCKGKIGLYAKGMPIEIEGAMNQRDVFEVSSDRMGRHTKENCFGILEYITGKLTEAQKEAIAKSCQNDLFSLLDREDGLQTLQDILKKSFKGDDLARYIYGRILALNDETETRELLLSYGVQFEKIIKMLKKGESLDRIKRNPYFAFLRYEVPIQIADTFARKECGVGVYDLSRVKGFVYSALRYFQAKGDTCCDLKQLEQTINRRYRDILCGVYFGVTLINCCILDMPRICSYHNISGSTRVYLSRIWEEESRAVYHFQRLQSTGRRFSQSVEIEDTERFLSIHYTEEQRAAFDLLKNSGVKILTGPPGSGKTATISGLIHNFEENQNGTVKLAATTGMAARVIRASAGRDCETAHKMLRVLPYNDTVRGRDLNDPVDADLIIVDEVSMMGLQLFSILLQAVRNGSILLLVGDEHQLQSVDYGNVLHDLADSGKVEICRLTKVLRQSGSIRINADRINKGIDEMVLDQQFRITATNPELTLHQILEDYDPYKSQVISPVKNGPLGTKFLNRMLQAEINGANDTIARHGSKAFRYQDKVILTKTNYDAGYVNGDIGTVVDASSDGGLILSYYGGLLHISPDNFPDMELAYAITVHKSQGSEFDKVHIVLPETAGNMMTRRLLHTAVSRAKEGVVVYNEGTAFQRAVSDAAEKRRQTKLKERLTQQ